MPTSSEIIPENTLNTKKQNEKADNMNLENLKLTENNDRLSGQLLDIERKIDIESKIKQSVAMMKSQYSDPESIKAAEQSLMDSDRRLKFLKSESARLRKLSNSLGSGQTSFQNDFVQEELSSVTSSDDRSMNNIITSDLDYWKSNSSLNLKKIMYKIKSLQYKISFEQKIKAGAHKFLELYQNSGSKAVTLGTSSTKEERKLLNEAETNVELTTQKINLLKAALSKYTSLDIGNTRSTTAGGDEDEGLPIPASLSATIVSRKAEEKYTSGKFSIVLGTIITPPSSKGSKKNSEVYIEIRIDDSVKATSKVRQPQNFTEVLDFYFHRASDFEILLYDKSGILLGLSFWKISDMIQNYSENEASFEMEPIGTISMKYKYVPPSIQSVVALSDSAQKLNNKLGRQQVIKRKLISLQGHSFVSSIFYQPVKCVLCNDFIIASAFQCTRCRFLCHKKCQSKLIIKCIGRDTSSDAVESSESQFSSGQTLFKIPHRWDPTSLGIPAWCSHCGHLVPIANKKAVRKCSECSLVSHTNCSGLIPNFCGMSIELASQLKQSLGGSGTAFATASKSKSLSPLANKLQDVNSASALDIKKEEKDKKALPPVPLSSNVPSRTRNCIEDFVFLKVLGKGNFGKVMLAEEKATKKLYAIKVLKKDFVIENDEMESLKAEKRIFLIANEEQHPFLINLHSCFQSASRLYFVMEYISGGDLMWHIQRYPFGQRQAKMYAAEVLLALEYFHKNNVVYRDLKLDNILLNLDGHIKIADYGLCKENMSYGNTTRTFCGTPEFMAPEILLEMPYSRAVDWWAFGVLLYEMLLGQSPFHGACEEEIFEAIIGGEVVYPSNMPIEAVSIIQKLLTKDPTKRLGSSSKDAEEIKKHPFFKGIDWSAILQKKVKPTYFPQIKSPYDTSNFDQEFTSEVAVLTPTQNFLTETEQQEFKNFTYSAPIEL